MTVRFPDLGIELTDRQFELMEDLCLRLRAGVISGITFQKRAREISRKLTPAVAYAVCSAIAEGRYEYVAREIKWLDVLVSVSLKTTSSKRPSSERYFEGRIIAPVPYELKDEVTGDVGIRFESCSEVDSVGDLFIKCIYMYFESKGYESQMLDTADWYAGVQYLEEYMDREDRDVKFGCTIYDKGSALRPMNIRRWHDVVDMPKMYWKDIPNACRHFGKEVFRRSYQKSFGKGVRWG